MKRLYRAFLNFSDKAPVRLFGNGHNKFDFSIGPQEFECVYSLTVCLKRGTALSVLVELSAVAHDSNHFRVLEGEVQKPALLVSLEYRTDCRPSRLLQWHVQDDINSGGFLAFVYLL